MGRLPARPGMGRTDFLRGALAATAILCAPPAQAGAGNVYVTDTTVAFEDTTTSPDEDVNDVALRYNARCRLVGDGTALAHQEIRFTPVAAGATLINELWLGLPGPPGRVTLAVGGDAPVALCEGDCAASVRLLEDFEQAFAGSTVEFVNTTDEPTVPAEEHVVYVEYDVPPALGAVTCPPVDFQVRRPGVVIDGTTALPGSGMPLRAAFPGDWDVPRERTRLSDAYTDFLDWLGAVVGGCEPGSCPAEDWFLRPTGDLVVERADLEATAPLEAPATCSDGLPNQDETDADCGGALCGPCTVGEACAADPDCDSGVCDAGECAAPSCGDGVANGDETGLDCGGPTCAPCGLGDPCATADDCLTGACGVGLDGTCGAPLCSDGAPAASGAYVTCSVEDGVPYQIQVFPTAGTKTFTAPAGVWQVEALVVGGGGGAGGSAAGLGGGGGGGGGGFAWFWKDVVPGAAHGVTVGSGGTGGTAGPGGNGGGSSFLGVAVAGGGGGGSGNTGGYAKQGGSGGGAGYNAYYERVGAYGIPGQGHAGGVNRCSNWSAGGGGAGGAGENQGNYTSCGSGGGRPLLGGLGGPGVPSDISGTLVEYGAGGNGTVGGTDGQAGAAGTGHGGHGTYANANGGKGGNGGSGTVVVRFVSASTCDNGVLDGDETDIDCGGTCGPCANGGACRDVEDCASGYCGVGLDGTCGTATCFDGAPLASGSVRTCTDDGLGAWEVHTYTATGTRSFTPPPGVTSVEVLVVAGGGGGGGSAPSSGGGGGGGAGGLKYVTGVTVTPGTPVTVTVGVGGPGGSGGAGSTGGSSSFGAVVASGGGGGGSGSTGAGPTTGGSGGGAGYNGYNSAGGASGIAGQGHAGGDNRCSNIAAGGGGAGGPGQHQGDFLSCGVGGGRDVMGGLGGPGLVFDLTGYARTYARGGDGAGASVDYAAGAAGTGNGGNGSYGGNNGGKGGGGGSGTVIVRFPAP